MTVSLGDLLQLFYLLVYWLNLNLFRPTSKVVYISLAPSLRPRYNAELHLSTVPSRMVHPGH